jgi:hypothetical protein
VFTERLLVLCVPLMVACSDSDNATGQEPLSEMQEREGLASMRAEIETIVGLSGPLSTCRSIALGAKPCGGPWQYLVYSTAQTDSVLLVEKVAEYNAREADINARHGSISDCMLVVEPPLGLRDGQCAVADLGSGITRNDTLLLVDGVGVDAKSDPFDVGSVRIVGDVLMIEVRYGGGCAEHSFTLLDTGIATKSIPPQHRLRLVHDGRGDTCEAYLSRELFFDISPLRKLYSSLDRVVILIEGIEGSTLYTF